MPTPPSPAPGAQVSTYTLTDLLVPANGDVKIAVDSFADKANANDVTIVNASIDPITILTIEKFGDNDNQQDVIRVDLSEFSDNFTLVLKNTGSNVQDQLYLEGLQSFTDNGDGTFTGTYYGTDGELYTVAIQPEDAAVTPYYALDGIVTGEEGAQVMGVGYTDLQGDEIDGVDGVNDVIIGGGGRDTITAGAGNDTIYGDYEQISGGASLGMPPNAYTGTPPGPAAGAEVFAFSITDTNLDANGAVVLTVDAITPNKELAQDFTITDDALTEGLTSIKIEKGGGNDGSADIYRFDLQNFDDDFFVELVDEDAVDRLVFENVHSISVNPDGTYLLTYEGADSAFHEVTVSNDLAQVDFYLSPGSPYFYDDSIDAGAGDDVVDGGIGDDTILGGDGADTLGGGDGSDTIDGGAGDDVIEGDRTGPSQALADTLQYSYAQNTTGGQATHFGEQGTGGADDPLNFIDGDIDTEARYHVDDIIEYSFGQEVPAGTSITLIEGPNGVDDGIVNVYVSFGSTDLNGDTLSGGGGGVGYENAITNGDAVLIYSGPSDSTIDLEIPINATHIQFVGIESHGGWAEIEFTDLMNPLDAGDDSITGGDGNDLIDAMGGNDTVDGGAENDTILGGTGADFLLGGDGLDSIDGGIGNDQISGDAGADFLDGGLGDDTIQGGDGADTITGGDSSTAIPLERVAFEWSAIPDPDDGGQIDNLDPISTGTQDVNGVTVDYAFTTTNVTFADTGVYTGGIDAGTGTVNSNSALSLDDEVTIDLSFSEPVNNVSFNIADLEVSAEVLTIYAFDADGNPIPFSVVEGSTIVGSDTDAVAGNDQFVGTIDPVGDVSASGAIEVSIPGPVASIQIVMTAPGSGSLVMSDVWFDEPGTGFVATGNDLLQGGADADTFVVLDGFGNDTIIGGEAATSGTNYDTIDLSGTTAALKVEFTGDKAGTITDGNSTIEFSEIERLILGSGADTVNASLDSIGTEIIGGEGDDSVIGGSGADTIDGGIGSDLISGGLGADDLSGGSDNDTLIGGDGDDVIDGGSGDDSIFGGDGNDTLTAGNNTGAGDYLSGDAGNDVLNDSFWNAILNGGADADIFNLGTGTATVIGGEGGVDYDTASFANADDTVDIVFDGDESGSYTDDDGDSGTFVEIEAFELTSGNDRLDGTASSTSITVDGGAGSDTLIGGSGDDSIDGGAGDDSLTGGDGDDLFVYSGGSDTITDFNAGNTGGLKDGDPGNNDRIDLTGYYDSLFEVWADQADDGILNQSNTTDTKGNLVDYSDNTQFFPGDGLTFTGATADNTTFTTENTGVVCFTPGTLVLTESGERPIETLRPGDRIATRDNGVQVLQWIAHRKLGKTELEASPNLRPIWIAPDLIGASAPLLVSPQHGLLLDIDNNGQRLVRATHLERLRGGKARLAKGCRQVTYIHLMFDAHQIIFANGAPAESFYPGPMALKALDTSAKDELQSIFPQLFQQPAETIYGDRVRTFARFKQLPERQVELRAA